MSIKTLTSLLFLGAAPSALAWGTLGHDTVALIAQKYLANDTVTYVQDILGVSTSTYLASVATWADSYRYTAAGKFSAPFHYIDAEDSPPSACNVDYDRDCGAGGCVVSAINNYTTRVQDTSLPATERLNALKFIVHFVGDIHQPLHDEAINIGGNTINVTFDGEDTNLHHIWDTNMPEKLIGGYSMSDAQTWASDLTGEIDNGSYSGEKAKWLSGIDLSDAVSSSMTWARDANSYVCSTVIPDGVDGVEGKELDGAYYDSSITVIELQVAKAGYRLAAWLNLIATGSTALKVKRDLRVAQLPNSYMPVRKGRGLSAAKMAREAFGHKC
ncbi:S1/P1 nuclease [Aulographum hederae CBS 113979]|uniref:S1/P1 nuclease n=1 Tax=Aulographum hederae CBS 113979 TaxID=1176131 RepID=A0A6G1GR10_9PEZI|nr:S1/P1 nuclease [Aulographum hederae CBS 113979]